MNTKLLLPLLPLVLFLSSCKKDALPDGVEYEVVFSGSWNSMDHPLDFPDNDHFSKAIGMTHSAAIRIWEVGGIASDGIEDMAETGQTNKLENEVQPLVDQGDALMWIKGEGLDPGTASASFSIVVDEDHPLVSLVSMIAPSPDWFVGVESLSLMQNGDWVDELIVPLNNYDAGTDSGSSFRSSNEDTQPREPIAEISEEPLDYDTPLATFTFIRVK